MIDQNWTGEERRSIPIHILTYIDKRLDEHLNEVNNRFDDLETGVKNLTDSITSFLEKEPAACMEKCERLIDEMVPAHPENPTATPSEKRHEHRKAHASWINKVEEEMQRWKRIREDVTKWAIIGVSGAVVIAVWQFILKGPQG